LRVLGSFDVFGEMAILRSSPRHASVIAIEDTKLLRLGRQPFLDLVKNRAEVMLGVIIEYTERLEHYMRDLSILREQLETVILPLGVTLSAEDDPHRLTERILVEAMRLSHADLGAVYLCSGADQLQTAALRITSRNLALGGASDSPIPYPPFSLQHEVGSGPKPGNVVVQVVWQGKSVNVPDVYAAGELDFDEIKARDVEWGYRSESYLAVPLIGQPGEVMGVLQLINAQDPVTGTVIPFGVFEQLLIESLSAQAAAALNTQLLLRRQKEYVKLEQDMHVARRIQAGFLPRVLPQVEGWEIAAKFEPAREVAGDFYDAFMLTQNRRIALVIADVVDKGVPAALFMALVRSLTRAFAQQNYSLDWSAMLGDASGVRGGQTRRGAVPSAGTMPLHNAVLLTNNYILQNHSDDNMFATLFFAMLDPSSGQLAYINAGHNPPFIVGPGGKIKAKLTRTGDAVGMLPDLDYSIQHAILEPGDLLFTYTDGVTEARNPEGKFVTESGLLEWLANPASSATAMLDEIGNRLHSFVNGAVQADDITMLAIRRGLE
jgi:sigma-B regulation protein RsbU (phosphoserine phosphatase)